MSQFTEYVTKDGDRWDSIAHVAYGDATAMGRIIDANPTVPIYDVFPGGVRLRIPVVGRPTIVAPAAKLPPWKRL